MPSDIYSSFVLKKAALRGQTQLDWLKSYHTFSFGDYYDKHWKQFRTLRVMNEDWIAPTSGFGSHPHRDMEIITYVISGTLEHQDSLGNKYLIHAGEVQRMTAGTGIVHSEYSSSLEPVHLYQIWILPNQKGLQSSYEQKSFQKNKKNMILIASPDGQDQSLQIHQDVYLYKGKCFDQSSIRYNIRQGYSVWLQVVQGEIILNDLILEKGDGLAIEHTAELYLESKTQAEFLLFELN